VGALHNDKNYAANDVVQFMIHIRHRHSTSLKQQQQGF